MKHRKATSLTSSPERTPLSIRPYARLLTMLGEQLLKNECIALVELIKNAYDADASKVEVIFDGFAKDMRVLRDSRIVVRDNGHGMTLETVKTAWMNPATPTKFLAKRDGRRRTPERNRVIQGEKGIGRFAVLKLARKITVTTRATAAAKETVVWYDFTRFDDDFLEENRQRKELFLDEVKIDWEERQPETLPDRTRGTVIEMKALRGKWSERLIKQLCRDVANLTEPVSKLRQKDSRDKFKVSLVCNGKRRDVAHEREKELKVLLEDKPVFSINGQFNGKTCTYHFNMGAGKEEVSLYDERVKGLWIWRRRYSNESARATAGSEQSYSCGDFAFQFYIFDFTRGIDGRHLLTQEEKGLLKDHRVYLYRDGMRVYPYGDPEDDWLNIDISRGVGRAGDFFSNDQIIGWVEITQKDNPNLRDQTNREGLIETGGAAADFVFLIGTFLSYVKQYPFQRYQAKQRQKNEATAVRDGLVAAHLANLQRSLRENGEKARAREVAKIASEHKREHSFLTRRAEMTEDLAGVGLSVEMASHDIMLLLGRAQDIGVRLAKHTREGTTDSVQEQADMLVGVLQQILVGMRDVQGLFRSSRRRRQNHKVEPILDKIHGVYAGLLERLNITYNKVVVGNSPVVMNTTDGVIMQVLINLFDNAAYWLDTMAPSVPREILVTLDGDAGELVFADGGPGVNNEDKPYIFEAFFSGKGEAGRGLGLYIARQLLDRHGYTIEIIEPRKNSPNGATFVVRSEREGS